MSTIQSIARFKIYTGRIEDFKRLSEQCMQLTRQKDTGTLRYEIFFNEDQTEAVVYEEYVDTEAAIQHFKNMGDVAGEIFTTGEVSGEIWGEPNAEMRKAIEGQPIRLFSPFGASQGMTISIKLTFQPNHVFAQ